MMWGYNSIMMFLYYKCILRPQFNMQKMWDVLLSRDMCLDLGQKVSSRDCSYIAEVYIPHNGTKE